MNGSAGSPFGAANPLVQLAPFGLILVVFYFLLVRPQQQKARETQSMLDGLRVNDEIVSTGGLHGRIVKVNDKVLTVEIAPKVQIRLERQAVASVARLTRAAEKTSDKQAEKASEGKSA